MTKKASSTGTQGAELLMVSTPKVSTPKPPPSKPTSKHKVVNAVRELIWDLVRDYEGGSKLEYLLTDTGIVIPKVPPMSQFERIKNHTTVYKRSEHRESSRFLGSVSHYIDPTAKPKACVDEDGNLVVAFKTQS